jgi:hypothetical protein
MFFKRSDSKSKNTENLLYKLIGGDYTYLIKPELRRYIKFINHDLLNSPDEIETFINNFTRSKALNTNRYLFLYLISPETKEFISSVVYDKYTDKIEASSDQIYTFRINDEKQTIHINKDTVIQDLSFTKFGYNIYGVLLTYEPDKEIYSVSLWTNFLPKYIKIFNIGENIFKKNLELFAKVTILKQLIKNRDDLKIIPARVELFYHPFYHQILTSYIFQVDEHSLRINTEFFRQEVKEAYYTDPYNELIKVL